jgi:acetylglutamate kinase
MDERLLLLYLDREHVGDSRFVKELSARLTRLGSGGPYRIVVHESGPQTEQALEGRGLFVERSNGVFNISSAEEQAIVERSIRQTNRRVVALLTEHQVASVSVQGADKGLFSWSPGDGLQVGPVNWIHDLFGKYVTPVVSSLATDRPSGEVRELPGVLTVSALAEAFDDISPIVVYFTTDKGLGIRRDDQWLERIRVDELSPEDPIGHLPTVRRLVERNVPVLVTSGRGLKEDRGLRGTRVVRWRRS